MNTHVARKRFGQNFLHDANVVGRILAAVEPQASDFFVEIGPGQGALTRPLNQRCGKLDVIEIDRDLAATLQQQDWANNIDVHLADALKFDFGILTAALGDSCNGLRLVGNLPYNISTPLLFHILDSAHLFRDIHVMLQKEVVQRMAAGPGNRTYGRLSVALAARCTVQSLFIIKPGAFRPAPKVQSAFARLTPLPQPLVATEDWTLFDTVLRSAFGQRRKQLGNALQGILSAADIVSAGIDPKTRAEQLGVDDFVALTQAARHQTG